MRKLFTFLVLGLLLMALVVPAWAAQHDYIISNADGATVRADINAVLQAIASNNANSTEPATTYAYQWWLCTANGTLQMRNAANTGWIAFANATTGQPFLTVASNSTAGTVTLASSGNGTSWGSDGVLTTGLLFEGITTIAYVAGTYACSSGNSTVTIPLGFTPRSITIECNLTRNTQGSSGYADFQTSTQNSIAKYWTTTYGNEFVSGKAGDLYWADSPGIGESDHVYVTATRVSGGTQLTFAVGQAYFDPYSVKYFIVAYK